MSTHVREEENAATLFRGKSYENMGQGDIATVHFFSRDNDAVDSHRLMANPTDQMVHKNFLLNYVLYLFLTNHGTYTRTHIHVHTPHPYAFFANNTSLCLACLCTGCCCLLRLFPHLLKDLVGRFLGSRSHHKDLNIADGHITLIMKEFVINYF